VDVCVCLWLKINDLFVFVYLVKFMKWGAKQILLGRCNLFKTYGSIALRKALRVKGRPVPWTSEIYFSNLQYLTMMRILYDKYYLPAGHGWIILIGACRGEASAKTGLPPRSFIERRACLGEASAKTGRPKKGIKMSVFVCVCPWLKLNDLWVFVYLVKFLKWGAKQISLGRWNLITTYGSIALKKALRVKGRPDPWIVLILAVIK